MAFFLKEKKKLYIVEERSIYDWAWGIYKYGFEVIRSTAESPMAGAREREEERGGEQKPRVRAEKKKEIHTQKKNMAVDSKKKRERKKQFK